MNEIDTKWFLDERKEDDDILTVKFWKTVYYPSYANVEEEISVRVNEDRISIESERGWVWIPKEFLPILRDILDSEEMRKLSSVVDVTVIKDK